jgi:hypothetical protein
MPIRQIFRIIFDSTIAHRFRMKNIPFPSGSSLVAHLRDSGHETQELSILLNSSNKSLSLGVVTTATFSQKHKPPPLRKRFV